MSALNAPHSGARNLARGTRFLRTPGVRKKRVPLANMPARLPRVQTP
jgi:hypothetical protein